MECADPFFSVGTIFFFQTFAMFSFSAALFSSQKNGSSCSFCVALFCLLSDDQYS